MTGLDTNILVRFLTRDDPVEFERARHLLDTGGPSSFFVPDIVLAELVWVLQRAHRRSRDDIARALEGLVESDTLAFESTERVRVALTRYRAGRGGFADYLLAARAWEAGCETVVTFDRDLLSERGFVAP